MRDVPIIFEAIGLLLITISIFMIGAVVFYGVSVDTLIIAIPIVLLGALIYIIGRSMMVGVS